MDAAAAVRWVGDAGGNLAVHFDAADAIGGRDRLGCDRAQRVKIVNDDEYAQWP
jgi:hypothetical protein